MAFASALAAAREGEREVRARRRATPSSPRERPFRASLPPPAELSWSAPRTSRTRGSSGASAQGAPSVTSARSRCGARWRSTRRGWRVGVVNGLSVFSAGDVEFGQPMRITAVVGIGREGLIDVEREAQLGGQHPHEGRRHPPRVPRAHVRAGAARSACARSSRSSRATARSTATARARASSSPSSARWRTWASTRASPSPGA